MNTVLIRLNSYAQQARIFINDREPSSLSELANYNYAQYLANPSEILDAISRELNDDFSLAVTGNAYEYELFAQAAAGNDYCVSCTKSAPAVAMPSKERAKRLAQTIEIQTHIVQIVDTWTELQHVNMEYGPITVFLANNPTSNPTLKITSGSKLTFDTATNTVTYPAQPAQEQLEAIIETHLINPIIGKAVADHAGEDLNVQILSRLTPILRVSCPQMMEAGKKASVAIESFPDFSAIPPVVIESQNPDVICVEDTTLIARATGSTAIKARIAGENKPFFVQQISCENKVLVSSLKLIGFDVPMNEGCSVPVSFEVLPADALDAKDITWESSDPSVAAVIDGQLTLKSAGTCKITAKASKASVSAEITVQPKLRGLQISENNVQLNVGKRHPIKVTTTPAGAYNGSYKWTSTDDTVAVVVEEDGQEMIKAVGIGDCTLTCSSADGEFASSCEVSVQSIMYAEYYKKAARRNRWILLFVLLFIAFIVVATGISSFRAEMEEKKNDLAVVVDKVNEDKNTPAPGITQTNNQDNSTLDVSVLKPVDPFDPNHISVIFSGRSGEGTVNIKLISDAPVYSCFNYTASTYGELNNGDVVTLEVSFDDKELKELGYVPPEVTSAEYEVTDLSAFINNGKIFPAETLNSLAEEALISCKEHESTEEYVTKESEVLGVYFISPENAQGTFYIRSTKMHNAVAVVTGFYSKYSSGDTNDVPTRYVYLYPDYLIDEYGALSRETDEYYEVFVSPLVDDVVAEIQDWTMTSLTISELTLAP